MTVKKHKAASGEAKSENHPGEDTLAFAADDAAPDTDQISAEQLEKLCRERICPECSELAKLREDTLRIMAEADNVKKRLQREKEEFCKFATQSVLEDLLPVLDNLDLALEHGRKLKGCSELAHGVEMTRKIFLDILAKHELEPLGAAGEEFDPTWHEALGQQPHPEIEPGRICQLVQKGYRLKGRLVRPAKVLVSQQC